MSKAEMFYRPAIAYEQAMAFGWELEFTGDKGSVYVYSSLLDGDFVLTSTTTEIDDILQFVAETMRARDIENIETTKWETYVHKP